LSNVRTIAAGNSFACAVQADGTVACWGDDEYGEIGSPPQDTCFKSPCTTTPAGVAGVDGVTAITAGDEFACALIADGTVRCWGFNGYGQLGDGTTDNSSTPVVVQGLEGVVAVSASTDGDFACALKADHTIWCWGSDANSELGTPTGDVLCDGGPCVLAPTRVPL